MKRNYALISGSIEGDAFRPAWWVTASDEILREWASRKVDGAWYAVAVAGAEIIERAAGVVEETPVCGTGKFAMRFSAVLRVPEEAVAIVVMRGSEEVYRRQIPRAEVRVEFQRVTLSRGPATIGLHLQGPSPGDGAYVVLRWHCGASVTPLGFAPVIGPDIQVAIDLTEAPGGPNSRLAAVYYDGIRAHTVFLEGLEIPRRPAQPRIVMPLEGMRFGQDGIVPLQAELSGDGDVEKLEWIVNGDRMARGALYAAVRLPAGQYRVTLRHGEEEATTSFAVTAPGPEFEIVPVTPPWRTRPVEGVTSFEDSAPGDNTASPVRDG